MKKLFWQIMKFGVVGGLSFVVDFLIFAGMNKYLGIHYIPSQITAFLIATIFNYIASVLFVFESKYAKNEKWKETLYFIVLSVIGLLITVISLSFFVEQMQMDSIPAKILSTILAMVWNFITRKLLIEKK